MRILRIVSSMNPQIGGPVESIKQSSKQHWIDGHSTDLLCCDDPTEAFLSSEDLSHLQVHAIGRSKTSWCYQGKLKPWLKKNLKKYDAVISHGLWHYHTFATRKLILKENKVWFIFPHGSLDPWFQNLKTRPIKSLRNILYWKSIECKNLKEAKGVLFTCEQEKVLSRKSFRPYDCNEMLVKYGTSSPPSYEPEMTRLFNERCPKLKGTYLLFLSRIHPKKGVDLLLDSYIELKKKKIQLPSLVIAGPGKNSDYGKELIEKSKEYNDSIFFPGMLEGKEKWAAFYGSEAFILPSHQENFGIVVAEALACSKPVLITKQVNIHQEIQRDMAGFIDSDDKPGITRLLNRWIQLKDSEKKEMESSAKKCFLENFEITGAARSLIEKIEASIQKE